ncbi:cell surface hydrolase [Limosilactobacillus antri DSM 16041]|uniref:Cell surface hydrolase n=1 Tax=Limosilactobacillus antri DSM 16041 TaxID=525309 RepID=A0ABR5P2T0_9LACO|nr:cell surface hydrolase [Limosilactobacillus antri DSM 16041]
MLAALAIIAGFAWHSQQRTSRFVQSTTPTLFFHGGGSSYHAEEQMVSAAKKAGVTKTVLRADVNRSGQVTLHGTMQRHAINPIVEVNYQDNRQLNFQKHGEWAANVVRVLQQRYGIDKVNMVGHSLGNISIIYYELQNGRNPRMPQLQKQVDIAGHFAGLNFAGMPAAIRQPQGLKLAQNGKPNKMNATYREMTKVRQIYPKGQVAVLNIVGDVGHGTDGTVPNVSSLSLKYLVASRAKSYQVKVFHGKNAQHSKLHDNPAVNRALIKFLWEK